MWCNFYSGFSTIVAIYIVANKYPTDQPQVFQIHVYYYVCLYMYRYRIMMLIPDCSNCPQVISAKCTMLLSLFFKSFLRSVLNYCDTLNMEHTNIWYLWFIYFYTRINFLLQLFIILIEWFYFIMRPNQFFERKWFKFKKKNCFRSFDYWNHWNIESFFLILIYWYFTCISIFCLSLLLNIGNWQFKSFVIIHLFLFWNVN